MARSKTTKNGNSPTSKKLATVTMIGSEVKKSPAPVNLEDQIRLRAYEIYQERGYVSGNEREDWLTAEREVMARSRSKRQSA